MSSPAELRGRVSALLPEIVELRRMLHRIPEVHHEERETAREIRRALSATRIEILPPYSGTDTVGILRGVAPGRHLLLRADIDALPVEEKSGKPWKSNHPGRAHACGHDGHTAILLGVARVLDGMAGELKGSVRFVFQPAEEEEGGGKELIERGLLDAEPRPEAAFALHGWIGLPAGRVSSAPGTMMAAADRFVVTIRGRGGHAALPHRAADPVVAAAQVITGLQSIVSRSMDPLEPAVVSVCSVHGGRTSNVIPDEVVLEGTTRYFDAPFKELIRKRMGEILQGTCAAGGCTHSLEHLDGYAPLANDPRAVALARAAVSRYLGAEAWDEDHPRTMGAEDFSFYLQRVPGALLRLGLGRSWPRLHSPEFDFNDESLETGIVALAGLALEFCSGEGQSR